MTDLIYEQSRCISHEIRNHISICELYTQIIRRNLEKENIVNDSFENALNCITKSLKIMNNSLLDLKSLNNISLEFRDLKSVLEEAVNLSQVYIGEKDIKIYTDFTISVNVCIDENKFLACIVNIIKNAIEAINDKGEINISLFVENNLAKINISNTGEPISAERQQLIFEEGFTTKICGSGLGLHICKNNLKSQNAELKLITSTKELTEFQITLSMV